MNLAEALDDFGSPVPDKRLLDEQLRNWSTEDRSAVEYMYSVIESGCASYLEARAAIAVCMMLHMRGCDPIEVRQFVQPQYPVDWLRLDMFVRPWRNAPNTGFAIECDGEKWHNAAKDARRDAWLREQGISVLRIPGATPAWEYVYRINQFTDNFLRGTERTEYEEPFR